MTIYENDPNKDTLLKFIEREIASLKMISHPNVIQFYGIAEKERSFFLLTELVAGGDLHWYIKNLDIKMSWRLVLLIAKDIASSMVYLHNNNVVHRDLKSTNLLVAENWVIKVCDFGLARKVDLSAKSQMTICGTDDWMAPEVLLGESYDKSCDVFSFGIVLIELVTRLRLTPRIRNENLGIDQPYVKSRAKEGCPNEILELIFMCCREKPQLRPTFEKIEQALIYLLENLKDIGQDVDYPPLRTFQPPELTMAQISKDQSFPRPFVQPVAPSTLNGSNKELPLFKTSLNNSLNSFPRPYVSSASSNNNNNNETTTVISSSPSTKFTFPRPYQGSPSSSLGSSAPISAPLSTSPSGFSFPRPYQPTDEEIEEELQLQKQLQADRYFEQQQIEEEEQLLLQQQLEQQEQEIQEQLLLQQQQQQQEQEIQEQQQPQQQYIFADSVVSFHDSELLSFPRPYQPEEYKSPTSPLLIQTDYSFPRPWNPEYDKEPPLSTSKSISQTAADAATQQTTTTSTTSTANHNTIDKNSLRINITKEKIDDNVSVNNRTQQISSPHLITVTLAPPTSSSLPSSPKSITTPVSNHSSTQSTPTCTPSSTPTKTPSTSPFVATPPKKSHSPPTSSSSAPTSPHKSHVSIQDRIKNLLKGGGSTKNINNSQNQKPESPSFLRKSVNTKDIIQKYEEITKRVQAGSHRTSNS
ncbi:LISK family protein kinase [Heterostelium album PN500]|uniref:non-specific serine/threonine protein kinase n=1 Tax=Heterostelium pallidum (strain ATCC 26659 / Pp 5 / PN500) TaxID=670386 RepID=D3BB81_HETP5|nr:LISK family protein kinase [Heterostelium album PN500]EFA81288.1 LISK family protein kinase [Heterostelium album PN500]|eukprot:XP_020433406.1 LISK family protein kinase [Heterostelium album PN500]